jgi:hypothetical protein
MYKEYSKDNFKIILTLIDGTCPCINIYFDVYDYNYTLYGPKKNFDDWVNSYLILFDETNYVIEYLNTHVILRYNNKFQTIDRVEYPMNYILRSMERIRKLEEIVATLVN